MNLQYARIQIKINREKIMQIHKKKSIKNSLLTNIIFAILFTLIIFSSSSCDTSVFPIKNTSPKEWQTIYDLEDLDIWDVKIYNDEIYVAGIESDGRGFVYKSSDAINWVNISPLIADSLNSGVGAIDFLNGNLIGCFSGKPVYLLINENIIPLTEPILNDVREIIVDSNNNILIGTFLPGYYLKYVTHDKIINIYDSLYTPPYSTGCFRQSSIQGGISVSKLLKDTKSDKILIGNYSYNNHFITVFNSEIIDCFPTEGLSYNDKFFGCHDIIFINDILFAAGFSSVKFFEQNSWKIFGDTLPNTPDGKLPIATSIAYDKINKDIYVTTNYIGVLKWVKNQGWLKINEGLKSFQGFYDPISRIIFFKNKVLIFYGSNKVYKPNMKGALFFPLN